MKIITLVFLVLGGIAPQLFGLPRISPAFLLDLELTCETLVLAEFPIRQGDLQRVLALPEFEWGLGMSHGGKEGKFFIDCPISAPDDPNGQYSLMIYFGPPRPNPSDMEVVGIEVAYTPAYVPGAVPIGRLIYRPADKNPEVIRELRQKIKDQKITPGEFVRARHRRPGSPTTH